MVKSAGLHASAFSWDISNLIEKHVFPLQRDEEDMIELARNCPSEFREYYIQMQAAKRSQAPLPSQVT